MEHQEGLGAYEMGDKIGQGTYGSVFFAKEKNGKQRNVAIKSIAKSQLESYEKIVNERDCLVDMKNCKQIIDLYETLDDEDNLYFVIEIAELGDLQDIIEKCRKLRSETNKDTRIDRDYAKYIVGQIVLGLEAMHKANWAHRDLKPGNMMVTKDF